MAQAATLTCPEKCQLLQLVPSHISASNRLSMQANQRSKIHQRIRTLRTRVTEAMEALVLLFWFWAGNVGRQEPSEAGKGTLEAVEDVGASRHDGAIVTRKGVQTTDGHTSAFAPECTWLGHRICHDLRTVERPASGGQLAGGEVRSDPHFAFAARALPSRTLVGVQSAMVGNSDAGSERHRQRQFFL